MKLICEINEDLEYLSEEADGGKNHYIKGVFMQGAVKNRNGRVYPMEVLQKEKLPVAFCEKWLSAWSY